MKLDENKLIAIAKPYFDKCRAGDWNHALRIVELVKELSAGREDFDILVCAAYLHDIGWSGVMPVGKVDFDKMLTYEDQAVANTGIYVPEVLHKLGWDETDIATVLRLIGAADQHRSEKDDEAIIVDADNLSKLCIEHLQEKYRPESYQKLIQTWENELATRIRTDKGREIYPSLLAELKQRIAS